METELRQIFDKECDVELDHRYGHNAYGMSEDKFVEVVTKLLQASKDQSQLLLGNVGNSESVVCSNEKCCENINNVCQISDDKCNRRTN